MRRRRDRLGRAIGFTTEHTESTETSCALRVPSVCSVVNPLSSRAHGAPMAIDSAFVADVFSAMGQVTVKRMFGGAGVYADGVMFALVWGDGTIGVKADDALKAELA